MTASAVLVALLISISLASFGGASAHSKSNVALSIAREDQLGSENYSAKASRPDSIDNNVIVVNDPVTVNPVVVANTVQCNVDHCPPQNGKLTPRDEASIGSNVTARLASLDTDN